MCAVAFFAVPYTVVLNLAVATLLTLIRNAVKAARRVDATVAADYVG